MINKNKDEKNLQKTKAKMSSKDCQFKKSLKKYAYGKFWDKEIEVHQIKTHSMSGFLFIQ